MQIIQSKLLNQFCDITHGFTTKKNGNLAFHVGDAKESVVLNHQRLASLMSYDKMSLVHMKQIHSSDVKIITSNDNFSNPPTCDALITNKRQIPLMVMVADCSPILFYDSKREVIAVAHAGRAGAFNNIVQNVLQSFEDEFGSNMSDIYVSVGTSIGECCYEVGKEIYEEAKNLNLEYSISFRENSYNLNVSKIIHKQLLNAKIKESNIEFSHECSSCDKKYFSYRAEGLTGRFAGVIYLN